MTGLCFGEYLIDIQNKNTQQKQALYPSVLLRVFSFPHEMCVLTLIFPHEMCAIIQIFAHKMCEIV